MARRVIRTRCVRPAGRQSLWVGLGLTTATLSASAATLVATLNAAALALRPFTIVRTHLDIFFESDQSAAGEFTGGVFSMQVVTETAAAAGIASIPTPLTETDADFFVYQGLYARLRLLSSVGFVERGADSTFVVDSKSMRKVSTDDDVALVAELRYATGANMSLEGRMLVKLH